MWKQKEATNLLTHLLLIIFITGHLLETVRALSDKRLCADENCKTIISTGSGQISYRAGQEGMVSFNINANIKIKSKSAGSDPSLWGIEVNGREGYAPKRYIKETKIYVKDKDLKFEVDVKPKISDTFLSTSEKFVEQKNPMEATTTTPLNRTPESNEKILNNNSNDKITETSSVIATPVQSHDVNDTEFQDKVEISNVKTRTEDGEAVGLEVGKVGIENSTENVENQTISPEPEATKDIQQLSVKEDEPKQESGQISEQTFNQPSNDKVARGTSDDTGVEKHATPEQINVNETQAAAKKLEFEVENEKTTEGIKIFAEANGLTNANVLANTIKAKQVETDSLYGKQTSDAESSKDILQESDTNQSTIAGHNNTEHNSFESNKDSIQQTYSNENKEDASDSTVSNHKEQHVQHINEEHKQENWESIKQSPSQTNSVNSYDKGKFSGIEKEIDEEQLKNKPIQTNVGELESEERNEKSMETSNFPAETNVVEEAKTTENISLNENQFNQTESAGSFPQESETNQGIVADYAKHTHLEDVVNEKDFEEAYNNDLKHNSYEAATDTPKDFTQQTTSYQNHISENFKTEITETENPSNPAQHMSTDKPISDDFKESPIKESTNTVGVQNWDEQGIIPTTADGVISDTNEQNSDEGFSEADVLVENDSPTAYHPTTKTNDLPIYNYNEQINFEHLETDIQKQTTENFNSVAPIVEDESVSYPYEANENENTQSLPSTTSHVSDNLVSHPYQANENENTQSLPSISSHISDNMVSHPHQTNENENIQSLPSTTPHVSDNLVSHPYQTNENENTQSLPSTTTHVSDSLEVKENEGLFATIMGTVNNMLTTNKKNKQSDVDADLELDRILNFQRNVKPNTNAELSEESNFQYCQNIGPNGDCPESEKSQEQFHHTSSLPFLSTDFNFDTFLKSLATKILEISDLLAVLVIASAASLFFVFGYYCFCNSSREGALLSKLNQMESNLLALHKENAILKHNLMSTRQKLTSIEDNSFGSNDMVVSLKKELEEELLEKARLQEQITVLQKELENAADAGIELNKIVSELLSNQTGDESIISSVEELQKQLNEQQNTIYEINASLAEKSRENSELQLILAEQNARYEAELANLQRDNDELDQEKGNLITKLDEMRTDFDKDITAALEGKNLEIKRLQNEILDLGNKLENEHTKWQTSVAKIEALEECLKNVRKDPSVNINEVIDVANVKAQLIETQKKYNSIKEKLETQLDSRKLAENQLEIVTKEVEKLKQDFNQSEKDKLEAQTRLEVLSNYFKDKENQLQKELSLKEAMWLKQQGETTTTVDRVTAMQEEIQSLRSQNDSLRAEIEAQVAAHKAQTGTLENRAHETWLAARQADRRYEEARAEATALRRKLTALAGGNVNDANKPSTGSAALGDELAQAPSPIHMESPGSPLLGRMPPPPFLPPPFMGPPPPFMSLPPPPPFVPHGEMRPAPLGRIMSPPPQRSGRFSPPQHLDYEDYLDYESNNTWHRHTYSPPPRTYRSLSPTDSRYNYGTERDLISTYDTETDFSPPPSPRESRRRGGNSSERIDSNTKISYGNTKKFNTSHKGPTSSGSEKSFNNTLSHNDVKTKKGNPGGGVKHLV